MLVRARPGMNFWQYVKNSDQEVNPIDRDRAMEYVRKYCLDVQVFKLFMMGAQIAFNQVRQKDSQVLQFFADFQLEPNYDKPNELPNRVVMKAEIRVEEGRRSSSVSKFYDIILILNSEGMIIDIDYKRLLCQIGHRTAANR